MCKDDLNGPCRLWIWDGKVINKMGAMPGMNHNWTSGNSICASSYRHEGAAACLWKTHHHACQDLLFGQISSAKAFEIEKAKNRLKNALKYEIN